MVTTYTDVLARNVRAARSRADLSQQALAERMRQLGFDAWLHQTAGNVERGKRGLRAEEILGLAYCLGTSAGQLMTPLPDDGQVELPSGMSLPAAAVRLVILGTDPEQPSSARLDRETARGIRWQDNTPEAVTLS